MPCEATVVTETRTSEKDVDSCEEAAKEEIASQVTEGIEVVEVLTPMGETHKCDVVQKDVEFEPKISEFDRILNVNRNLALEISKQQEPSVSIPKNEIVRQKPAMKPYTEAQLAALYTNSELEMLEHFTLQYVEAELKGLAIKQHPLYELLASYLQVRGKITGMNLKFCKFGFKG